MQLKTAVSILAFALTASAAAHRYDPNKPITLTGTVKELKWNKPYVKIHLSVKDTNGKTKDWELETATPNVLESNGLVRTSLKKGDQITVKGEQAANGSEHALVQSITLPGGQNVSISTAQVAKAQASETPVADASPRQDVPRSTLPSTATNLPLLALVGLVSLGLGAFLSLLRGGLGR